MLCFSHSFIEKTVYFRCFMREIENARFYSDSLCVMEIHFIKVPLYVSLFTA